MTNAEWLIQNNIPFNQLIDDGTFSLPKRKERRI